MVIYRILLQILLIFFTKTIFSQNCNCDSLYDVAVTQFRNSKFNLSMGTIEKMFLCETSKRNIIKAYNLKGNVFAELDLNDLAIQSYKKSILLAEKAKDTLMLSKVYANLGGFYQSIDQNDSAIKYLNKAQKAFNLQNDSLSINRLSIAIGTHYFSIGNYNRATQIWKNANTFFQKNDLYLELSLTQNSLGNLFKKTKDYNQAIEWYQKSLNIKKSLQQRSLESTYKNLYQVYKLRGDLDSALQFLEKYVVYNDSLRDNDSIIQIQQNHFETEKELIKKKILLKDKLIESEKQKSSLKTIFIFTLLALLIFLGIILVKYLSTARKLKKLNQKESILNDQLVKHNNYNRYLINILSHDVKNYLSGIERMSSFIVSKKDLIYNDQVSQGVVAINTNSIYLITMFKAILNEYEWDHGDKKNQLRKQNINLLDEIQIQVDIHKILVVDKAVNVVIEQSGELKLIELDKELMNSVFRNLLINAIKYGKKSKEILIKIDFLDKYVTITFTNYIDKNLIQSGTGFGLRFVNEFISAQGGQLTVEFTESKAYVQIKFML